MHHDKKVGLGLGILLVGFVGAFFFREEPRTPAPLPELQSAEMLDREISESLVDKPKPYTDLDEYEQQYKPVVNLEGIETSGVGETAADVPPTGKKVFDAEFDFLNEPAEPIAVQPEVAADSGEAGLAGERRLQKLPAELKPQPKQDVTVSQTTPGGKDPAAGEMFAADLTSPQESPVQPFAEDQQPFADVTIHDSAQSSNTAVTEPGAQPGYYIVQKGDTLSGIASRLLGRQGLYRKIFELNRDQLASPDDLRPGMRLRIPTPEQLREPTEISLTRESQELPSRESAGQNAPTDQPQPAPKRDRRVIVPRRVRLNEPIARNPDRKPLDQPSVKFKLDRTETESKDDLPTLEGLEPLDVPR